MTEIEITPQLIYDEVTTMLNIKHGNVTTGQYALDSIGEDCEHIWERPVSTDYI